MRTAPAAKSTFKIPLRGLLLGVVAVAFAMVGLALLAEAMSSDGGTVYLANVTAGSRARPSEPTIEVTGYGQASAPAERAVVQLLIIRDVPYGSDWTSSQAGAGTPTASTGRDRSSLSPLLNAIEATGVDERNIEIIASPSLISVCSNYSRCSSVRIDVTVEQPRLEHLNAIVNAAGRIAAENGMALQDVGVGYTVADCRPLTRKAREIATTDARTRAQEQAEVLGVALGKLLVSSEVAPTEPRDATGCVVPRSTYGDSWWTAGSVGLTVPFFDPTAPPEATVTVQVSLAYAIVERPDTERG